MSKTQALVVGIIGGMGTLAGIHFQMKLCEYSHQAGACRDQEFPRWIYLNATDTPSRLLAREVEIVRLAQHLSKCSEALKSAGADYIVVPCNAAHGVYGSVHLRLAVPWIGMHHVVVNSLCRKFGTKSCVGVLGTDRTIASNLYKNELSASGIRCINPEIGSAVQNSLMSAIYDQSFGIKASGGSISARAVAQIKESIDWCIAEGADVVVTACTEISVALKQLTSYSAVCLDPLDELARHVVHEIYRGEPALSSCA